MSASDTVQPSNGEHVGDDARRDAEVSPVDADAQEVRHDTSNTPAATNRGGAARLSSSLTEEQLAFYRKRLDSGYYRSSEVRLTVAERLSDDLFPKNRQSFPKEEKK